MKDETKKKYIDLLDSNTSDDPCVVDIRVDKKRLEELVGRSINLALLREMEGESTPRRMDAMDGLAEKIHAMNEFSEVVECEMLLETPKYEYKYWKVRLVDKLLVGEKYYPYFIQLMRDNKETDEIDSYRIIVDEEVFNTEKYPTHGSENKTA